MANIPIGSSIRIKRTDGNPHRTGGKLIAIAGDKATVHPIGHRGTVVVPLRSVVIWKSRNEFQPRNRRKGKTGPDSGQDGS
jgi:hypothetical protein